MNKISIEKIKFKAFRSFVEEQTIDLPPSGLVLINGFNKDSNTCSGSGKSNVVLTIPYALQYFPFFDSEAQSWLTDDYVQVELSMSDQTGPISISRRRQNSTTKAGTKAGSGHFKSSAIKGVSSQKVIQEEITKMTGMSSELLSMMTYRHQKTRSAFLMLPNKEKRTFLSKILNLDNFEPVIEKAIKRTNELSQYIESQDKVVQALQEQIANLSEPSLKTYDHITQHIATLEQEKEKLKYLKESFRTTISQLEDIKKQINARTFTIINESHKAPEILALTAFIDNKHAELDNAQQLVQKQKMS